MANEKSKAELVKLAESFVTALALPDLKSPKGFRQDGVNVAHGAKSYGGPEPAFCCA